MYRERERKREKKRERYGYTLSSSSREGGREAIRHSWRKLNSLREISN
jgi:hypothetical protein